MTAQVLFYNDFSEKDPHHNAVETTIRQKYMVLIDLSCLFAHDHTT